jgi:hypothetical protein
MLAKHGIPWSRLWWVGGDRVHLPGTGAQKSNKDLAVHVARELGLAMPALSPPIRTVKRGEGRGSGSLSTGSRWLYHAMVAGRFSVSPDLSVIAALGKYRIDEDDDEGSKDRTDAIRYALDRWVFRPFVRGSPAPIRLAA